MNVLVLGGTRFVGRHIVERLAGSGHRVVSFHRGGTACELPAEVEERRGDRDVDLSSVNSEAWDAIVDTSCYRPEQILRSLGLRTDRYLLISTINVYRDLSVSGVSEEAPTIETFDSSDEAARYSHRDRAPRKGERDCSSLRVAICTHYAHVRTCSCARAHVLGGRCLAFESHPRSCPAQGGTGCAIRTWCWMTLPDRGDGRAMRCSSRYFAFGVTVGWREGGRTGLALRTPDSRSQ